MSPATTRVLPGRRTVRWRGAAHVPVHQRVGAERLDEIDRETRPRSALARRELDVLGPDAEHDVLPGMARGAVHRQASPVELDAAIASDASRAGSMFMAGEPMKPATNVVAGRS